MHCRKGKNERERPQNKLWPTPTPANGVIRHPKESEQQRRSSRTPERARLPVGVPARKRRTAHAVRPHPSVARAAAPPHRQRVHAAAAGAHHVGLPATPPATCPESDRITYGAGGPRAPATRHPPTPTDRDRVASLQTRTPATDACEEAAAPLGPSLRPPATVTSGAAPGL